MGKLVEISSSFNHRWKRDPLFRKGFDYENVAYADVPDDLKWAIPLSEAQKSESNQQYIKQVQDRAAKKRRSSFTLLKRL